MFCMRWLSWHSKRTHNEAVRKRRERRNEAEARAKPEKQEEIYEK